MLIAPGNVTLVRHCHVRRQPASLSFLMTVAMLVVLTITATAHADLHINRWVADTS
eukprot:COSAG01_NODE_3847_length_5644_cov_25.352209_9_plen_56_part_00